MKDYSDFPPFRYFIRVLKNCPKSAHLYAQVWKNKNRYMNVQAIKRNIRKDYLISPTMFRNLLAPLMYMNLITFVEDDDEFQIDVMGSSSNEKE